MMVRSVILLAAAAFTLSSCSVANPDRLVVAAGTTLVDSGFIELVVDAYQSDANGVEISVVGLSSAEALAYADAGNADLVITHEPQALAQYLETHPGAASMVSFASRFILVGPQGFVSEGTTVVDAFRGVAGTSAPFVSRDDGSGTYARERSIWSEVPYVPDAEAWYVRTGSGMASTLLIASQRSAVTLAELGAYLSMRTDVALDEIPLDSQYMLDNPYDVTVVDSADSQAVAFSAWLASDDGRTAIESANEQLFGMQVYRAP